MTNGASLLLCFSSCGSISLSLALNCHFHHTPNRGKGSRREMQSVPPDGRRMDSLQSRTGKMRNFPSQQLSRNFDKAFHMILPNVYRPPRLFAHEITSKRWSPVWVSRPTGYHPTRGTSGRSSPLWPSRSLSSPLLTSALSFLGKTASRCSCSSCCTASAW